MTISDIPQHCKIAFRDRTGGVTSVGGRGQIACNQCWGRGREEAEYPLRLKILDTNWAESEKWGTGQNRKKKKKGNLVRKGRT